MSIIIPVLEASVYATLGALVSGYDRELRLAALVLACRWFLTLFVLLLLPLAFATVNMLVPQLIRGGRRCTSSHLIVDWGGASHRYSEVADRAENDVVIIHARKASNAALMIVWPPMICTMYITTKCTLEGQKVLLVAVQYVTALPHVFEFHLVAVLDICVD